MTIAQTLKFIVNHPLGRFATISALARFTRWQIGTRILGSDEIVHHWLHGARFIVKRGQTGLTGNIYVGLHEFDEMAFLLHFLKRDDLFVDVGANVGSYTLLASAVIGARTIAVEPVPQTYQLLVQNVALNRIDHLTKCENIGLADVVGQLAFTCDGDTVNHVASSADGISPTVLVPVRTLDALLAKSIPTLIKIDVEGYELPVINGGLDCLDRASPMALILELNGSGSKYGFDETAIVAQLTKLQLRPFRYHPFERRLEPLDAKNSMSGNTIFIRDVQFVERRVLESPRFSIHGISF